MPIRIPTSSGEQVELKPVGAEQTPLSLATRGKGAGIAQGLRIAGSALGTVANQQLQDEARRQERDDLLTARDLYADLGTQYRDLMDNEYAPRKLGAAKGMVNEAQKTFDKLMTDALKDQSVPVQFFARQLVQRRIERHLDVLSRLESDETVAHEAQTRDAIIGLVTREALNSFNDEEGIESNIAEINAEIDADRNLTDDDKELAKAIKASAIWEATSVLLAEQDPAAARARLEERRDELGEPAFARASKKIDTYRVAGEAQAYVDVVIEDWRGRQGDKTQTELLDEARANFADDPELRDAVVTRLGARMANQITQEHAERVATNESVQTRIDELLSHGFVDMALLAATEGDGTKFIRAETKRIRDFAAGKGRETDQDRYNEILAMSENELRALDVSAEPLADKQADDVVSLIRESILGERTELAAVGASRSGVRSSIIDAMKWKKGAPQKLQFDRHFNWELERFVVREKRLPTATEMDEIGSRIVIDTHFDWWDNKAPFEFKIGDPQAFSVDDDDFGFELIPFNAIQEISAQWFAEHGSEPSNDEILEIFKRNILKRQKKVSK